MITFSQTISDSIPDTSLSAPKIGAYFTSVMIMSVLSLMANVFVLYFHHKDPENPMPRWFESFFCETLPGLMRIKVPPGFKHSSSITQKNIDMKTAKFNQVSNNPPLSTTVESNNSLNKSDIGDLNAEKANNNTLQQLTEEILNELGKISEVLSEKMASRENNKWKFAAKVIDRFCFLLFSTLFFASLVFILLTSKNFYKYNTNENF
jgi:hypothetical protein